MHTNVVVVWYDTHLSDDSSNDVYSTDTPMIAQFTGGPDSPVAKQLAQALPGGRMGEPAEVAEAAAWLCSDRARWISGATLLADGGQVSR